VRVRGKREGRGGEEEENVNAFRHPPIFEVVVVVICC